MILETNIFDVNNNKNNTNSSSKQMDRKEFVQELLKTFWTIDFQLLSKWIEHTINALKLDPKLLSYYNDIIHLYFSIIDELYYKDEPTYEWIAKNLNEFFLQFQRNCLELDWSTLFFNKADWIKVITFSLDCLEHFNSSLFADKMFDLSLFTNTLPIMLNILLIILFAVYPPNMIYFFKRIFLIYRQYKCTNDRQLISDYWSNLAVNINLCIQIFYGIINCKHFTDSEIEQFILFLVDIGLSSDSLFKYRLTQKSIKILVSKIDMSSNNVPRNTFLFLLYQNEISELLLDKLEQKFSINILYDCLNFFSLKSLPDELIRRILPVYVVKCNEKTKTLIDHLIEQLSSKPISLIKQYFKDILVHLFYDCKCDSHLLFKVIQFLTEYCQENIYKLVHDLNRLLIQSFLQRISIDLNITLRALSFVILTIKSESEQIKQILQLDLQMFEKNEDKFRLYLQKKFFHFHIEQIDQFLARIIINNNSEKDKLATKKMLINSCCIILHYLDQNYINRFRMKIYFIIRQLLSETIHSDDEYKIILKIIDHFISNVYVDFLENELFSIYLLVIQIVQRLPADTVQLLLKLLSLHKYKSSLIYQIYFVLATQTDPVFKPITDYLNEQIRLISSGQLNADIINDEDKSVSSNLSEQNEDENQLIKYLTSDNFNYKCNEFYFLLENLENMNEKQQEVILKRFYSLLNINKQLFYKIYKQRSNDLDGNIVSYLNNIIIHLKISSINSLELFSGDRSNFTMMDESNTQIIRKTITLQNFFRHLILKLFFCIKFSTGNKITELATDCLGIIGAIDVSYLDFHRPFQREYFNDATTGYQLSSIDYSNYNLFYPKKKIFKLLILDILMNMVKSSNRIGHNCASYSLQTLLPFFADNANHYSLLLRTRSVQMEIQSTVSTQQIEHYVQNRYYQKDNKIKKSTKTQEDMDKLTKIDQIKEFMQNEKNDSIDLDKDLPVELNYYRQVLDTWSRFNSKDLKTKKSIEMETFFSSIKPTMSYTAFLNGFINMFYLSFIIPHLKSNKSCSQMENIAELPECQDYCYEEILTQPLLGDKMPDVYENLKEEFNEIRLKIGALQTPEKVFIVCYYCIFSNVKLSYMLMPGLMLLSLGLGTDQKREEFAQRFRAMIEEQFLQHRIIFQYELGQMGSELLFYIYDYLKRWEEQRRLAHSIIINDKQFRRHTVRNVDKEFYAIKLILESVDSITMAKLAYEAGAHSKALQYLEQYFNDCYIINGKEVNFDESDTDHKLSSSNNNEFVKKHSKLYLKVYHGLEELDSIQGLQNLLNNYPADQNDQNPNDLCLNVPSVDHLFHQHLLDRDYMGQIICGTKLLSNRQYPKTYLHDVYEKYLSAMINLDQRMSMFLKKSDWPKFNHYQLETMWKLNSWDGIMDQHCGNMPETIQNTVFSKLNSDMLINDLNQTNLCTPSFGYILASLHKEISFDNLDRKLSMVRQSFLSSLNSALLSNTLTTYARSYESSLVPIHIIQDIKEFISIIYQHLFNNSDSEQTISQTLKNLMIKLINDWNDRNKILPDGPILQQVLDVQRTLIQFFNQHNKFNLNMSNDLYRYWHKSINCSLNAGQISRSYISLMEVIQLKESLPLCSINPINEDEKVDFVLNEAEVFWIRNDQTTSIELLRNKLNKDYKELQQYCYLETLKQSTQMPEEELNCISSSLSLKLTKDQFKQLSSQSKVSLSNMVATSKLNMTGNLNTNEISFNDTLLMDNETLDQDKVEDFARLQLRYANYCERAKHFNSNALMIIYKSVTVACPQWEEAHFQLAMFFRRLYREYQNCGQMLASKTPYQIGKPNEIIDLKTRVIKSLCESLKFGSFEFVRVSLPILLNIWIDLGHELLAFKKKLQVNSKNTVLSVIQELLQNSVQRSNLLVEEMFNTVNEAIFLVELDTLIAHMLHPLEPIATLIAKILIKLIVNFPQHMAWQFARSQNSKGIRGRKSNEFVQLAHKQNRSSKKTTDLNIQEYFKNFKLFSNSINDLACYKPPKIRSHDMENSKLNINLVSPRLVQSLNNDHKFLLPCNQFFMPSRMNLERLTSQNHFFKCLFIEKSEENFIVMKSLQMPKKLTLICSNGIKKIILIKSGDDLRRDRAMLNFCNVFNQCHRQEISMKYVEPMSTIEAKFNMETELKIWARRRQQPLFVQTYFVVPLSDSCGIIEWIPGLCSFKSLIEGQYTRSRAHTKKFISAKATFIKSVANSNLSREKRIERFKQSFPSFHPPLFQNWFHNNYADSYSWYMARRNFTRTCAAFSILGYILGLCDRHAENIQLNPVTGHVIHVDLNCLFNRGELFMVPESVPFRLTHNMIAAMGSLGFHGLFSATCEDVLLICRQFREQFLQCISIFLYDHLLDGIESEDRLELTEKSIFNVEARLFGITLRNARKRLSCGNPMSIKGQVDQIIKEATDINNLGAMYHGWAAYL